MEVDNEGLDETLQLFVKLLSEPSLLEKDFIKLNIDKVFNEISEDDATNTIKDLNSYKETYILKSLSNPIHPFHAIFDLNALKATNINVLEELIKSYYQNEYVFKNIKLVIKGMLYNV